MATLESKFSRPDIETLIESMSDWESLGNQEFHLMNMVRNAPMPPEDHEAYEMMDNIKKHFIKREKDIKDSRETRQEKATLLKAKLMLVRSDMGIEKLFEMASESIAAVTEAPEAKKEATAPDEEMEELAGSSTGDALGHKSLERAEYFIKDMGVWSYYEKFLAGEKSKE